MKKKKKSLFIKKKKEGKKKEREKKKDYDFLFTLFFLLLYRLTPFENNVIHYPAYTLLFHLDYKNKLLKASMYNIILLPHLYYTCYTYSHSFSFSFLFV
jgi:hypothetical protein